MLGLDAWVPEKVVVCDHGHEMGRWHGFPARLANGSVIDQKSWCNYALKAVPILCKADQSFDRNDES